MTSFGFMGNVFQAVERTVDKAELANAQSAVGSMYVQPDKVDQLASFFEGEAENMRQRAIDAGERLTMINPPGGDPVSKQATKSYMDVASNPGIGYVENFKKLAEAFHNMALNLRGHAQQTRTDDQESADSFGGKS